MLGQARLDVRPVVVRGLGVVEVRVDVPLALIEARVVAGSLDVEVVPLQREVSAGGDGDGRVVGQCGPVAVPAHGRLGTRDAPRSYRSR